ncbi:hypothetical protein GGX14DRAFT_444190, partial [Mycena pura]
MQLRVTPLTALVALAAVVGVTAQGPFDCNVYEDPVPPVAGPPIAQPGNFADSCMSIFLRVPEQQVFSAFCFAIGGAPNGGCPSAFIGSCVGLNQGKLVCETDGGAGFNGTCTFSNFTQPVQRESVFVTGNCTDGRVRYVDGRSQQLFRKHQRGHRLCRATGVLVPEL